VVRLSKTAAGVVVPISPGSISDAEAIALSRYLSSETAEAVFAKKITFVEGVSDRLAILALARKRGLSLDALGVSIVSLNGAGILTWYLKLFGPSGFQLPVCGLCDSDHLSEWSNVLQNAGLGTGLTQATMETIGFFVCTRDLEDELIKSLGEVKVIQIMVERVAFSRDGIQVSLKLPLLSSSAHSGVNLNHFSLSRFVPIQMKRRGVELRLALQGDSVLSRVDLQLLKAVVRARRWSDELISGRVRSVDEIARREGLDRRSLRRLIPLGFLSPRVLEAILEGHQPPDLGVMALTRRIDLPLLWSAQEQAPRVRQYLILSTHPTELTDDLLITKCIPATRCRE
jgi:hypothetical protein